MESGSLLEQQLSISGALRSTISLVLCHTTAVECVLIMAMETGGNEDFLDNRPPPSISGIIPRTIQGQSRSTTTTTTPYKEGAVQGCKWRTTCRSKSRTKSRSKSRSKTSFYSFYTGALSIFFTGLQCAVLRCTCTCTCSAFIVRQLTHASRTLEVHCTRALVVLSSAGIVTILFTVSSLLVPSPPSPHILPPTTS